MILQKKIIIVYWDISMFTYVQGTNCPEQLVGNPNALRRGCVPGD